MNLLNRLKIMAVLSVMLLLPAALIAFADTTTVPLGTYDELGGWGDPLVPIASDIGTDYKVVSFVWISGATEAYVDCSGYKTATVNIISPTSYMYPTQTIPGTRTYEIEGRVGIAHPAYYASDPSGTKTYYNPFDNLADSVNAVTTAMSTYGARKYNLDGINLLRIECAVGGPSIAPASINGTTVGEIIMVGLNRN